MSTSVFPQGHALIVAVATYRHISPLPNVVLNDAKSVADILRSPQYCGYLPANVEQLLNEEATRENVLAGLRNLATRAGPDDTACVYFSGHGALIGGVDSDESSLLTVDCKVGDLAGTSISAADFSDALRQIKAKRLIVFLDACHAAGAGTLKGDVSTASLTFGLSEKTLIDLATGTGRALMASSRPSEVSLIMGGSSNSAFTSALIEGLQGAADVHSEGTIKVFDLFEHIAEKVPLLTHNMQHPIFKASALEQNFPIALSCGRTPKAPEAAPIAGGADNTYSTLTTVLPELYPAGPGDQEVWDRAGGDVSRLRLQGTGKATWFAALRTLQRGGGGAGIRIRSLVDTALDDFPGNPVLAEVHRRL